MNKSIFCLGEGDFSDTMELLGKEGTVVFVDPPYPGGFDMYTSGGFPWEQQIKLRDAVACAQSRGALVYVCNRDTPEIRALYEGVLTPIALQHVHVVNSDGERRKARVGEVFLVPEAFANAV